MELRELERIVPELVSTVRRLGEEVELLKRAQKPVLAAWVTLRQAAEYAGVSYHSIRRPENSHRRPDGGRVIRGVTRYPKAAVLDWSSKLGR